MVKNDKELTTGSKCEYTFLMLLNDIRESLGVYENTLDRVGEVRQDMFIFMQMLIAVAIKYSDANHHDEKLRNAVDDMVNNDAHLAGYIFFISQNPHFGYSWNYLRQRENSYTEFLVEGVRFLENVVADINMLIGKLRTYNDVHVVIDGVIDVSLIVRKPYVKARILWENFHRVATVKREYNFTVKYKECIIVSGMRKEVADAEKYVATALALLNKSRGMQNGQ